MIQSKYRQTQHKIFPNGDYTSFFAQTIKKLPKSRNFATSGQIVKYVILDLFCTFKHIQAIAINGIGCFDPTCSYKHIELVLQYCLVVGKISFAPPLSGTCAWTLPSGFEPSNNDHELGIPPLSYYYSYCKGLQLELKTDSFFEQIATKV